MAEEKKMECIGLEGERSVSRMAEEKKMGDRNKIGMELSEEHREEENGGANLGVDHTDELDGPFLCFICLELVHKPVVNACGHLFCFWCVHKAMNSLTESYCPLCRNPYMHFPRVCEQLHFLLLKALPEAYRRRCKEVSEEYGLAEEEPMWNMCSPQFSDGLDVSASGEEDQNVLTVAALERASINTPEEALPQVVGTEEVRVVDEKVLDSSSSSSSLNTEPEDAADEVRASTDVDNGKTSSSSPYVTVSDLLCNACKKLLYRPVVVNCGHVCCEGCLSSVEADGESIINCGTCGCIHPGGFPQVCLELHQYLEQNFYGEYKMRKDELSAKSPEVPNSRNNVNREVQKPDVLKKEMKSSNLPQRIHPGIGCDGCGMFPMFGRRFKCIDCPKYPGYDLCWHCFQYGTNLAGRFNQQHTIKHRVREVIGNPSLFDPDNREPGEGSEGIDSYFSIVGYFA